MKTTFIDYFVTFCPLSESDNSKNIKDAKTAKFSSVILSRSKNIVPIIAIKSRLLAEEKTDAFIGNWELSSHHAGIY